MTATEPDGRTEVVPLRKDADVVLARRRVREAAISVGLGLVAQTKIVTAASELGRNAVLHGGGGELTIELVSDVQTALPRRGLRLTFVDLGPGIADIDRAMTGGWSSGGGLGLGLPGSRQLVHEFHLDSAVGAGTTVVVVIWARD